MAFAEIKINSRLNFIVLFTILSTLVYSQDSNLSLESLKPDPAKEKTFFPYLAVRHGGPEATLVWKKSNTVQYYKELWYYCESFSIKRNQLTTGDVINEAFIDISRFESSRKQNEEATVIIPGFKDVIILKPIDQLIYKPDYIK